MYSRTNVALSGTLYWPLGLPLAIAISAGSSSTTGERNVAIAQRTSLDTHSKSCSISQPNALITPLAMASRIAT